MNKQFGLQEKHRHEKKKKTVSENAICGSAVKDSLLFEIARAAVNREEGALLSERD